MLIIGVPAGIPSSRPIGRPYLEQVIVLRRIVTEFFPGMGMSSCACTHDLTSWRYFLKLYLSGVSYHLKEAKTPACTSVYRVLF